MTIRYLLLCVVMCLLLSSCAQDMPKNIMPINKMTVVMFDVLSAQELAQSIVDIKDTTATRNKTFELYQQVFAIHKITREDFDRSFKYYEAHPDKIKVLFDSLTVYGARKKQETYMRMR